MAKMQADIEQLKEENQNLIIRLNLALKYQNCEHCKSPSPALPLSYASHYIASQDLLDTDCFGYGSIIKQANAHRSYLLSFEEPELNLDKYSPPEDKPEGNVDIANQVVNVSVSTENVNQTYILPQLIEVNPFYTIWPKGS
jgi:hypothetical protein